MSPHVGFVYYDITSRHRRFLVNRPVSVESELQKCSQTFFIHNNRPDQNNSDLFKITAQFSVAGLQSDRTVGVPERGLTIMQMLKETLESAKTKQFKDRGKS